MSIGEKRRERPGLRLNKKSAQIRLWAPFAGKVVFHNETTGIDLPLSRNEHGYWCANAGQVKEKDLYTFKLDDGKSLPDPASLSQPKGAHGPSEVIDLNGFSWTDHSWQNHAFGDYIIYELHTAAFSSREDFEGIAERLDYLAQLGVNAIELMPVAQFPGKHNWGYDGVFPFAVQNNYGGAAGLQQLVDTCHNKGFAVILDVVYNHLGPDGNILGAYGPYFTEKYKTPWGAAINFDDAYCDPVREFYITNALMWLCDFHIDALRLDAVHAIKDYSPEHILKEMNDAIQQLNIDGTSKKYLIAETDQNDSKYVKTQAAFGYGLQAQWCDEFHHALRRATGQEAEGYYADFDGIADLAIAVKNAYVYTGRYSAHRHRYFGTSTEGIDGDHFVIFDQNHDQVGNRMLGERIAQLAGFNNAKLAAALVLTAPFVPLLFMGEEWAAASPFLFFTDFENEELIKAINEGRQKEFAAFSWQGDPPAANAKMTFLKSALNWKELEADPHKTMFAYYRALIRLRKEHPAFKNYDRSSVSVFCEEKKEILIVERSYKEQSLYCIYNFAQQPHEVKLNQEVFPLRVLLSSSDKKWMGPADSYIIYEQGSKLTVQPESAIILANYHVST